MRILPTLAATLVIAAAPAFASSTLVGGPDDTSSIARRIEAALQATDRDMLAGIEARTALAIGTAFDDAAQRLFTRPVRLAAASRTLRW